MSGRISSEIGFLCEVIDLSIVEPIHVLCVFSTLDRGGAESMCMNLYRHIDRKKVQFDFVKHTEKKGEFEDEIASLGGQVFVAPHYKLYNIISYRAWWRAFLKKHPEHRIIHGHFFTISAVYFAIAKKEQRITVGHIHASGTKNRIKRFFVKQIRKYTDYPLACSKQAGEWAYRDHHFTVIKNALDAELFRYSPEIRMEMRRTLGLDNELTLGTVANFSPLKNPMGLIDIFLSVKQQCQNAKLLWIGDGGERERIETRIRQDENLRDSVMLLGTRNDVSQLLQAMDVFLLPSLSEGLPVSVIEAQASGLKCYISDRVTNEVDITGRCRFLPIANHKLWANTILADNISHVDTYQLVVDSGYDIHTTAKWLERFYMQIISKGGVRF